MATPMAPTIVQTIAPNFQPFNKTILKIEFEGPEVNNREIADD